MTINITADIPEIVFHVCDSTTEGVVVDWRYTGSSGKFEYFVTFSNTEHPMWFSENEIIKKSK